MKEYVIETKRISKNYGSLQALNNVSIHVKQGSIYGLVGDNGAGKSTLLKLLAGHSVSYSGDIYLLGEYEKKGLERSRKKLGCLVEQIGYFPSMNVEQLLTYYRIQKGIPDKGKIEELMRQTGLIEKWNSKCKNLSLGQKQRLGLAIALMGEPQLLLLDEPINGLDPSGIIEIRKLLLDLNENRNITILLSSHILPELQQLATDYGFLSHGKLIEEISAAALQEKCSDCLELSVSDVEAYTVLLEQKIANIRYQVLPDHSVRIYRPEFDSQIYSKLAADHGIYIRSMQTICTSLEDYYVELKNGGEGK